MYQLVHFPANVVTGKGVQKKQKVTTTSCEAARSYVFTESDLSGVVEICCCLILCTSFLSFYLTGINRVLNTEMKHYWPH